MLERLDNIIYMLLNDLKEANPVIKLATKEDTFENHSRTNLYIYIEIRRDFKLKISYLAELEELFENDVSLVQNVAAGCNTIKTVVPLESIKNFEEE